MGVSTTACVQRSKDSSVVPLCAFHLYVRPGDWAHVVSLARQTPLPADPSFWASTLDFEAWSLPEMELADLSRLPHNAPGIQLPPSLPPAAVTGACYSTWPFM